MPRESVDGFGGQAPEAGVAGQCEGPEIRIGVGQGDDLGGGRHERGHEGLGLEVARALCRVGRGGAGVGAAEADGLGEAVGASDCPDCSDCPSDCASSSVTDTDADGEGLWLGRGLGAARDQERIDGEGDARGPGQGQDRGTLGLG